MLEELKRSVKTGESSWHIKRTGAIETVSELIHPTGRITARFYPSMNGHLTDFEFQMPVKNINEYFIALKLHKWLQRKS